MSFSEVLKRELARFEQAAEYAKAHPDELEKYGLWQLFSANAAFAQIDLSTGGLYSEQLELWFSFIPPYDGCSSGLLAIHERRFSLAGRGRSQFIVLKFEDLVGSNNHQTLKRLCTFLDVECEDVLESGWPFPDVNSLSARVRCSRDCESHLDRLTRDSHDVFGGRWFGIEQQEKQPRVKESEVYDGELVASLQQLYAPYNRKLEHLLRRHGHEFSAWEY